MHALLYRSRSRASRQLLARDLNDLIESAERNNPDLGITGLLLYAEMEMVPGAPGLFLQWMEGPKASVDALFETIRADPRHTDVDVLGRGPSAELASQSGESLVDPQGRLFPIWSMGMVRMSELPATLDGFLRFAQSWDGRSLTRVA